MKPNVIHIPIKIGICFRKLAKKVIRYVMYTHQQNGTSVSNYYQPVSKLADYIMRS